MANSDYKINASGALCTVANVVSALGRLDQDIVFNLLSEASHLPPTVGMGVMIDGEIMKITGLYDNHFTADRGCADTIPAPHDAGATIWFYETGFVVDPTAYAATETVAVKLLTYSTSDEVPLTASPADALVFNFRFARPYAPGNVRVNGVPWFSSAGSITGESSSIAITWKHRDRVLQADQLVGYLADNLGPEPGVTYTLHFYDGDDLVASRPGITENTFSYTFAEAREDLGALVPRGVHPFNVALVAVRDGLESWSAYTFTISVDTTAISNPYGLGYRLGKLLGGRPAA